MGTPAAERRETHYRLNTLLSELDQTQLQTLLKKGGGGGGFGKKQVIRLGRTNVFVKRIPVTDLEVENPFSTRNLHRLPIYYNYGVGSAGLGVHREILAHIKTTNWVLSGAIEHFPVLYHHRIIPWSGERPNHNAEEHAMFVKYWNGNKNIDRYLIHRSRADYKAVLFMEHIPHTLFP